MDLSLIKALSAKRRLASTEGAAAQRRFATELCVPVTSLEKRKVYYVYVSDIIDVCLSGRVDILEGNYLFEVKNSLANPTRKEKLSEREIRECQFYMMLFGLDYAFFVVEHSKQIFVVPYDERILEETKYHAKELAKHFEEKHFQDATL